jgi:predicted acyltransferase (DUF342 family)
MPGFFQTALFDGQYFTDALENDVILRCSDNVNLLIGYGSNTESKMYINHEEIFLKGKFRLAELTMDNAYLLVTRPDQYLITTVGTLCNLEIDSNLTIGSNFFKVDNENKIVSIKDSNTSSTHYQLQVDSNILTRNINVTDTVFTSNLVISGNLKIEGTVTEIDTNVIVTERFSISNDGTGPALEVNQTGNNDIATFIDDTVSVLIIKDGGNIGINESNPTEKLHVNGNVLINSNLTVDKNVYIKNTLSVANEVFLQNSLKCYSNVSIDGLLEVFNNTIIRQNLNVNSNLYVDKDVFINNMLQVRSDVYLQSNVYIDKSLEVTSNVLIHNELTVKSNVSMSNNVFINGYLSLNELYIDLVNSDILLNGELSVASNVYLESNVFIYESLEVTSNVLIHNELTVKSNVSMSNNVFINGYLSLNELYIDLVNSYILLNGELSVASNVYLESNVYIYESLEVTSNVLIHNELTVKSNVLMSNNVFINGYLSLHELYIDLVNSDILLNGELSVASNVYLESNVYIYKSLEVTSNVIIHNELTVKSNVSLSNNVFINGYLSLNELFVDVVNSDILLNGELSVASNVYLQSNVFINQSLEVTSNVLIHNELTVKSNVSLSNNVFINGYLSLNELFVDVVNSDILLNGELSVASNVYLENNVYIDKSLEVNSNVLIHNELTVKSNVSMSNNVFINNYLSLHELFIDVVNSDILLNGELSVSSNVFFKKSLEVTSNVFIHNELIVKSNVSMSNNVYINNYLSLNELYVDLVNSDILLNGELSVSSNVFFKKSLEVTSNVIIHNELIVKSNVSISNNVFINGYLSLNELYIDLVNSDILLNGELSVASNVFLQSNVYIYESLEVTSNIIIHNELTVKSNVSLSNNVFINGYLSLNELYIDLVNSDILLNGQLSVTSNVYLESNVFINQSLEVTSNVIFHNELTVKSNVSLSNNVFINGYLSLNELYVDTINSDILLNGELSVASNVYLGGSNVIINNTLSVNSLEVTNVLSDIICHGSLSIQDSYSKNINTSNLYVVGNIFQVPYGPETNRPLKASSKAGLIYFNSNTLRFEGLHDVGNGNKEWLPMGGIIDIDGDTFVSAEFNTDDDTLSFFAGNGSIPRMTLTSNLLSINSDTLINGYLEVTSNVLFSSNLKIENSLSVNSIECENIYINDNSFISGNLSVAQTIYTSNLYNTGFLMKIPSGLETNRPLVDSTPIGAIYYNSNAMRFQGLHDIDGVKQWIPFGSGSNRGPGIMDEDGDTYISPEVTLDSDTLAFFAGDASTPRMTLSENLLSVNNNLYVASNLIVQSNVSVYGNLNVTSNFTIRDVNFPLPQDGDLAKILAINTSNDYQLVTLYNENRKAEFRSLFGIFETGTELEEFSGSFDFGVPKYWINGFVGNIFDSVELGEGSNSSGILAPGELSVDMSTLRIVEELSTFNLDFKSYLNISMFKSNGKKLDKIAGISVSDRVLPPYYFFLGTVDPNSYFFKYKFKVEFEKYYSAIEDYTKGYNLGYQIQVESIKVPHRNLHIQGTTFYIVEYICTYNSCPPYRVSDSYVYKYNKPLSRPSRASKYYIYDKVSEAMILKDNEGVGLYPFISYKKWKNSYEPKFYEKLYTADLGWGVTANIEDVYQRHHNNSNLKELYKLTYNYIKHGSTEINPRIDISDIELERLYNSNVVTQTNYNLRLHSDLNSNGLVIPNNINSITFTSNAFPMSIF